jgi:hypothetical protein
VTSYLTEKNLVNCAVLKGNSAGLRNVLPVVSHKENCAVHSGNPTVSSVYLPTPRWHHLKASHDIFLFKYHFLLHILRFLFFFSDNIMADVASIQQTTALFLSTIATRTRRHTELTKKLTNLMGKLVLCQRTFSSVFCAVFFTQLN